MDKCLVCGKPIPKNRKYCSPECYHKSPTKGRPPRKERKLCIVCGKPIVLANQRFCSNECYAKHQTGLKRLDMQKRVTKVCPICGTSFETGGRLGPIGRTHCSTRCQGLAVRKDLKELDYPHGSTSWRELRRKVIERDGFRCQFCGKVKDVGQLQVHHIIPTNIELNYEDENLITCCRRDHAAINIATKWGYANNPDFDPHKLVSMLRKRNKVLISKLYTQDRSGVS